MNYNPIGLFIQPNSINRTDLINHVRRAEYLTCSVLDDIDLSLELNQFVPYTVHREYIFEPDPGWDMKASAYNAVDYLMTKPKNLYYMVNCERSFSPNRLEMYRHMANRLVTYSKNGISPLGLVFGNWSSGSIPSGQGHDPNSWINFGKEFLYTLINLLDMKLANGKPALILGFHEYTSDFAWKVSDGGAYIDQPNAWPKKINWNLSQWHIGRNIQGLESAYTHFGITKRIPIIFTESLFDRMNDITGNYRHFHSLEQMWKQWYPDKSLHQVLADMHIWVWEKIYSQFSYVIGTHVFTWCAESNTDWKGFAVNL